MSCFPRRGKQEVSKRVDSRIAAKNAFAGLCKSFFAQFRPQVDCGVLYFEKNMD